jgi:phosphate transport system permease protein
LVEAEAGGIRTPLVGTLVLIGLSIVVAAPMSLATAIYLAEYMDESHWTTRCVRVGLEVLASVPSVVFGMFGLALFSAPLFTFLSSSGAQGAQAAFGRSFLVASIVMAIHVLPFMTKVMEEAVRAVPGALRQAAAGLGIGKWRSIRLIVLPTSRSGLSVAVILGMGLVAGDTAIVWLLLGGTLSMGADSWWLPSQWLEVARGTGSTLTTYTYFTSPAGEGMAPSLAFGAALVLMAIVLALNVAATVFSRTPQDQRL